MTKRLAIILFVGLFVLAGILFVFLHKRVNCNEVLKNSNQLTAKGDYKGSYSLLKQNVNSCTGSKAANSFIVQYDAGFAIAAMGSGDKTTSLNYAKKAIKLHNSLTAKEKSQIPDEGSLGIKMDFIQSRLGVTQ